jgi:hypothetical protein
MASTLLYGKRLAFVVAVLLVSIVESLQEGFLLVLRVLIDRGSGLRRIRRSRW